MSFIAKKTVNKGYYEINSIEIIKDVNDKDIQIPKFEVIYSKLEIEFVISKKIADHVNELARLNEIKDAIIAEESKEEESELPTM